jgi:hypothetical protein
MQFLFPYFLLALTALAIPIIIHLFFFRRFKKVYFTNVRFLREVKKETSARQKLRNLLVLAMRILALAFLVMAFAQPFIPKSKEAKKGARAVSLFIDNSFSMSAVSSDAPLIELAKKRARQIVDAYAQVDEFQILTHDFEGRHQRMVSQEDALALIDEITVSPAVRDLSTVLTRQSQALRSSKLSIRQAYLISDFQQNISDLTAFQDTLLPVELVPLQSVQEKNVSLDSAWFEAPVQLLNQTNLLLVKVRNLSDEPVENVRLTLRHEGQVKPVGSLSVPANSAVVDSVPITILRTGWHQGELAINDYPIQFDDTYFFAFQVAEKINVLIINESASNPFLQAALRGLPGFEVTEQNNRNVEYSRLPAYQSIILHEVKNISSGLAAELKLFVTTGGNLLVFPPADADLNSYRSFLQNFQANQIASFAKAEKKVSVINTDEFVFKDVFENKSANLALPATTGSFALSRSGTSTEEQLLSYRDGTSYLSKFKTGQGNLYLCAAPLSETYNNLVRNSEIFVPLLFKTTISSARSRSIAYTMGRDELIEADLHLTGPAEKPFRLKSAKEEFIPEQRIVASKLALTVNKRLGQAGIYDLVQDGDEVLAKFAFNYDRTESDPRCLTSSELEAIAAQNPRQYALLSTNTEANLSNVIGEKNQGVSLWRWGLVLALIFLALEVLILRLWQQ